MSRDHLTRRSRRLLERLSQLSSAPVWRHCLPQLAEHAPAIVDLALTAIAVGGAIVAMARCECRDCSGR